MTESQWNSQITEYLKNAGCIVFKHSDHFTVGIPDMSCTTRGYTTWFEIKFIKPTEYITSRLLIAKDRLQLTMMTALEKQGRAFYVIRWNDRMYVIPPSVVMAQKDRTSADGHRDIMMLCGQNLENGPWVTTVNDFAFLLKIARRS